MRSPAATAWMHDDVPGVVYCCLSNRLSTIKGRILTTIAYQTLLTTSSSTKSSRTAIQEGRVVFSATGKEPTINIIERQVLPGGKFVKDQNWTEAVAHARGVCREMNGFLGFAQKTRRKKAPESMWKQSLAQAGCHLTLLSQQSSSGRTPMGTATLNLLPQRCCSCFRLSQTIQSSTTASYVRHSRLATAPRRNRRKTSAITSSRPATVGSTAGFDARRQLDFSQCVF